MEVVEASAVIGRLTLPVAVLEHFKRIEAWKETPKGPKVPALRNSRRKFQNFATESRVQNISPVEPNSHERGAVFDEFRSWEEVQLTQGSLPRMGINQATCASSGREKAV